MTFVLVRLRDKLEPIIFLEMLEKFQIWKNIIIRPMQMILKQFDHMSICKTTKTVSKQNKNQKFSLKAVMICVN